MDNRIEIFSQMLERDPENTPAMFGLANEYLKADKTREAIVLLEKYLLKADDEGAAYGMLGNAYNAVGDPENARAAYGRGIEAALAHGHPSMAEEFRSVLENDI